MIEHFRSLAQKNRPNGGDSAHFENHSHSTTPLWHLPC